jgi:hypothetical protein
MTPTNRPASQGTTDGGKSTDRRSLQDGLNDAASVAKEKLNSGLAGKLTNPKQPKDSK